MLRMGRRTWPYLDVHYLIELKPIRLKQCGGKMMQQDGIACLEWKYCLVKNLTMCKRALTQKRIGPFLTQHYRPNNKKIPFKSKGRQ
jgi:hypothetical protein